MAHIQLPVTISKPIAGGRFADTREEFAAFVTATGYRIDGSYVSASAKPHDWRPLGLHKWIATLWFAQTHADAAVPARHTAIDPAMVASRR